MPMWLLTQIPGAQLVFFTPDTDVLVLALAHYYKLNAIRYGGYMAHVM